MRTPGNDEKSADSSGRDEPVNGPPQRDDPAAAETARSAGATIFAVGGGPGPNGQVFPGIPETRPDKSACAGTGMPESTEATLLRVWQRTLGQGSAARDQNPGATCKPVPRETAEEKRTIPSTRPERSSVHEAAGRMQGDPFPEGIPDGDGYHLLSRIGEGGMGVVWRGTQASLLREVAVKRIKAGGGNDEQFTAEALVTGFLDHPNIVPVHALGKDDEGRLFISMKLVQGTSWKDLLHPKDDSTQSPASGIEENLRILLQVCQAVAFAHSRLIIHRDLKPENVMVGGFGEVLVMDWGLAVDVSDKPASPARAQHKDNVESAAGTPSYMAPEMAAGEGRLLGPWTDVYLLGAILHEIITGEPPHRGVTVLNVLASALKAAPPSFGGGVPAELQRICAKALSREPSDRYLDARSFMDALEGYLRHSQSLLITRKAVSAIAGLKAAAGGSDAALRYAAFADAQSRCRQAMELWEGNAEAAAGLQDATITYAREALEAGDIGLARAQAAQMPPGDPEAGRLSTAIAVAENANKRRAFNAKLLKAGIAASVLALIAVLSVSYALVSERQAQTEKAWKESERQREIAETARREEEAQRSLAERRGVEMRFQRNRAMAQFCALKSENAFQSGDMVAAAVYAAAAVRSLPDPLRAERASALVDRCASLVWVSPAPSSFVHPEGVNLAGVDGSVVVTTCSDKTLRRWDLATGNLVSSSPGLLFLPEAEALSQDSRHLAVAARQEVMLFDTAGGSAPVTVRTRASRVSALACEVGGKSILCGYEDGVVSLLEMPGLDEKHGAKTHDGKVTCVAFDASGGSVLSGGVDGMLVIRERNAAAPTQRVDCGARVNAACFSQDGARFLAVTADGRIHAWDPVKKSASLLVENASLAVVRSVCFDPNGARILTASLKSGIAVWDAGTGAKIWEQAANPKTAHMAVFSRDGRIVVCATGEKHVSLLDASDGSELNYQSGPLKTVSFTQDGKTIASAGDQATVILRETASCAETRRLAGHGAAVTVAVFDREGARMLTAGDDAKVRIFDASSGFCLTVFEGHGSKLIGARFMPSGDQVLSCDRKGTMILWNAADGSEVRRFSDQGESVQAFDVDPIDGTAAVASGVSINLFDPDTGIRKAILGGNQGIVTALAFPAHGEKLFASSMDRTVRVWRTDTCNQMLTVKTGAGYGFDPQRVAVSGDGGRFAAGLSNGLVMAWKCSHPDDVLFMRGQAGAVHALALDFDGNLLAAAGADGTVRLFDLAGTGRRTRLAGNSEEVRLLGFCTGGREVVTMSASERITWDAQTGAEISRFDTGGHLAATADFRIAAKSGFSKSIRVADTLTGSLVSEMNGHEGQVMSADIHLGTLSVCSGSQDGTARLWDLSTGEQKMVLPGHRGWVIAARFSPDGSKVATGDASGTLRLWNARTGARELLVETGLVHVYGIGFDQAGKRICAATQKGPVLVIDAATGACVLRLEGHTEAALFALFSPAGDRILSGGEDKTARVWDVSTGKETLRFENHGHAVIAGAFDEDGTRAVTSSQDCSHRVWDTATGTEISAPAKHIGRVASFCFGRAGKLAATSSDDGTIRIWDAATWKPAAVIPVQDCLESSVTLTSDESMVAWSGGPEDRIAVFEARSGRELRSLAGPGAVALALDASDRRLAAGDRRGWVRVIDFATGRTLVWMQGAVNDLQRLAFSPDGRSLGAFSASLKAVKWDAATGARIDCVDEEEDRRQVLLWSLSGSSWQRRLWSDIYHPWYDRSGADRVELWKALRACGSGGDDAASAALEPVLTGWELRIGFRFDSAAGKIEALSAPGPAYAVDPAKAKTCR